MLLVRVTTAPSFIAPVKLTVPVPLLPAVMVAGVTEIAFRVGPAGGAKLTDRLATRGTLSTEAVICTPVGGADAVVVIVKNTSVASGGTTMLAGT